ncbi:MAG: bifunctional oligoribonuclease/PAP phosphatase NrnA [Aerococcaceae bacterium]|nr:bifunctional oligoribonuclease/PAP phosphatase NrnA [Aerococcaceae bacterium]
MTYIQPTAVEQLYTHIQQASTIILHRHVRPDPDAIGSQLGLKALLTHAFPEKRILAAGTISAGLSWLGEMDSVTQADYEDALVIVCDTANQPRIDGDHYQKGAHLIKIDHHPEVDNYGELQIVHTQASSCSEILVEIQRYLAGRLPMTSQAARLFYAGIVGDTGRFLFSSTTQLTFEVTAYLKQFDFDAYEINDAFMTMTLNEAKFQGFAFNQLVILPSGVAHLTITQADLATYGITEEQTNSVVGLAGRIEGVKSWVVCVEQLGEKPFYRCRLRSKGSIINDIAARHEGGGHPLASGANAYSQEEIATIIKELEAAVNDYTAQKEHTT